MPSVSLHLSSIFKKRFSQPKARTPRITAPQGGASPIPTNASPSPPAARDTKLPKRPPGCPQHPSSSSEYQGQHRESSRKQNQYREGRFWAETPFAASLVGSGLAKEPGGKERKPPAHEFERSSVCCKVFHRHHWGFRGGAHSGAQTQPGTPEPDQTMSEESHRGGRGGGRGGRTRHPCLPSR